MSFQYHLKSALFFEKSHAKLKFRIRLGGQARRGFKSRRERHMWVELVVGPFLCSERFLSGNSAFPLSLKTNASKFKFLVRNARTRLNKYYVGKKIISYKFSPFLNAIEVK